MKIWKTLSSALAIAVLVGGSSLPPSLAQQNPAAPASELDQVEVGEVAKKLIELDKYMTRDPKTNFVSFDVEAARRDGVSKEIIELASEAVAYQNELMKEAMANLEGDVSAAEVSVEKYPKLKKFRERARAHLTKLKQPTPLQMDNPTPDAVQSFIAPKVRTGLFHSN